MAITTTIIQRIIVPVIFALCILVRPVALSIPYLILLFYIPFVPVATTKTIRGHTGYFFKAAIALSTITVLLQISFQIVLVSKGSDFLQSCEFLEILFRHIGMISLHDVTLISVTLWLLPDIMMFFTSIVAFVALKKLTAPVVNEDIEESGGSSSPNAESEPVAEEDEGGYSPEQYAFLKRAAIFCSMAMLLFAATLQPSVPSAVYFIVFLLTATIWATYKEIDRGFAIICRLLAALLILHISALLVYQTPWPQEYLDVNNTVIRLLGFSPLIVSSCNSTSGDIRVIYLNQTLDVDAFLNPVALLLCYYALVISSGFILDAKLMRRSMKRLKTFKHRPNEGTSNDPNVIPLEAIGEEEAQPTISEHISFAIGHLTTVICKHSYIISNIMMMVWSIVYHSWLTFVFLLVANLLWIIPNQRKNMHRISPFVVIYAEFLLITQYLYCMNLTEEELPSHVDTKGINLEQIGFIRYRSYPCVPLLLKTLFTVTFWLTLRQMKYEDTLQRQSSTLAHLAAPFHVTVSAATTDLGPKPETKKSKLMLRAGKMFKSILMQMWIWIVVFALFFFAIYGREMTVFRIVYMALFLIFMVTFQLSWRVWKKMMYTFWVIVIGFSMLSLTMIYTYQFDRFDEFWYEYVGIDKVLQRDIGLVKYETKALFLRLFYPTLLVVITVVQLQMFHKKYLERLELPSLATRRESSTSGIQPSSSVNYGSLEPDSPSEEHQKTKSHYTRINVSDLKNLTTKQAIKRVVVFYNRTKWFFDLFWLFMELHFIKVILLLAFLLGINEVSAIHIAIITLTVIAVTSRTNTQTIYSGFISLTIASLFILKMIYQIEYIPQNAYDVNCTNANSTNDNSTTINSTDGNSTVSNSTVSNSTAGNTTIVVNDPNNNTANWVGFNKLVAGQTLMQLLSGYIVYIVALTAYNLILLYQQRKRFLSGRSIARPKVLFPRITRSDADKDISHLVKYLLNFAFYKFGVEVTLLMLAILISARMDVVAVLYAIWLCLLFGVSREMKHRIWPIFQSFIVILIVIQYIFAVNMPPFLCIDYPWKDATMKRLQELMWLPDPTLRNHSHKLLLDFLLLMCTCRQMLVFRIEKQYENSEFMGGSNKSVIDEINKLGSGEVPIETDDFVSIQKNWLDILKCIVFLGCFWVTLAIVFLAGSSHPNIYSIGYLVGSFIFLWQGGEFYLRPIHTILRWWKLLVAYNVLVIATKAFLHLPVCIFIDYLEKEWTGICFFQKTFGINCQRAITRSQFDLTSGKDCENLDDSSLRWDFVCFMFLIFQFRIFQSYYFCHIINESKASTILASRGAELIESLRKKQVKIQAQREEEILQKIKQKMDRIKANQQKLQPALTTPKTHYQAVRSGDYYLFEDLDEKVELDLLHQRPSAGIDDAITDRKLSDKMTIEQELASATHKDEFIQPDGEQPSTSRSLDDDDDDDDDEPDDLSEPLSSTGTERPVSSAFAFIKAFISGILVSMTLRLYKLSRNYRYVTRVLSKEKKALKQEKDFGQGHRIGTGRVWAPLPSVLRTQGQSTASKSNITSSQSTLSYHSTQQSGNDSEEYISDNGNDESTPEKGATIAHLLKPQLFPTKEQLQPADDTILKDISEGDEMDFYSQRHSILTEFFQSLWFALISNTDLICYLLVYINMVHSHSILALPMPLMVFLWGTLTVPRPSKTFWITLIAYTQVVVLIKCIAPLFLWLDSNPITIPENNPMAPPRIIGVEVKPNYATYDLILLLVVFFHRFIQKQMGIWKTGYSDDEYAVQTIDPNTIKTAIVNEREASASNQNVAVPKPVIDENGERDKLVQFEKTPEEINDAHNYFSNVSAISKTKYCSPFTNFFRKLLKMTNRVSADVYTYIFLCDFINFFVLLFGFTAFGSSQGDGGVASYLQENKIPIAFLIMLLLQFVFIIVDRALYLRKNLLGKIIFQFVSVVGMHIWLFFLVPKFSERSFNAKYPPIIYYGFKYLYFLLSAYQIRCGYPRRILGNCLTKGFTMFNLFAFKFYMMTPFLFELRTLMDWIWTDSTMPLFEWLKMEDIFANIFELKCSRQMEKDFPAPRGESKGSFVKYLMGGGFLIAIIGLVWGPLALFALGNTVGEPNIPYEVRVSLRVGPYEPVYSMSAQSSQIYPFNEQNYTAFSKAYAKDRAAQTFLQNYEAGDVSAVVLGPNSTSLWIISPPDFERLKEDLRKNITLKVQYKYVVSRVTNTEKIPGTVQNERSFDLKDDTPARQALLDMLDNIGDHKPTQLPHLFPKFLKVKNSIDLKPATQLIPNPNNEPDDVYFRNLTLLLHKGTEIDEKWWEVLEECNDEFYEKTLSFLPYADCTSSSVLYTFSDKLFPSGLSWLTAGGVIGIYTTFVFVASRFFRGLFSGSSFNIMYSELPFVDRILQLCLDIYLVRESLEFSLEEDLFAKLIFLYRSPEVMIRWTRPAEEQSSDEDEAESDIDETEAEKALRKAPSRAMYKS
ncbi:piezo-type mechanosensitive ion channel component isoform X28 [Sitodiplosis mosellana]|uniref:piezo-type mechanosensitive ion channel component isoform X28 n=1 Tax=Sitodiplosis mosellana TaxID=263140 RepID=UPI002444C570|nr:piezo-type mechanosensitive ion channel component isoform X28 [Sitodiplosis mosellana]XP_055299197.1 piezo-type mechanosensitive ion channel component isoform X28 [Sitodiplosis mosellana]